MICLGNLLPTQIEEKSNVPRQKPRQLPNAKANFERWIRVLIFLFVFPSYCKIYSFLPPSCLSISYLKTSEVSDLGNNYFLRKQQNKKLLWNNVSRKGNCYSQRYLQIWKQVSSQLFQLEMAKIKIPKIPSPLKWA